MAGKPAPAGLLIDVAQLLAAYRRGAELLGFCRLRLQSVEDQVKVLDDGQLKSWSSN